MSDLVKRLRMREAAVTANLKPSKFDAYDASLDAEAATRIERLKRELAAEKALADRLAVALNAVWRFPTKSPDYEAYRKARGM